MTDQALFVADGPTTFVPTDSAVGPWDASIVHGAAVGTLFAGRLTAPGLTLARLTIEYLGRVPMAPLTLECSPPEGGRRLQRRNAVLSADGREVAIARAVLAVPTEVELPEKARRHTSPFDPAAAPPLAEPHRESEAAVGHPSFDSRSLLWEPMRVEGDRRVHAWVGIARPVVEGEALQGVERAAVAADYAQSGISRQLPFGEWSFRNGEQTIHLAREPEGRWVGIRCEALVAPSGAGFNSADLFDEDGWFGRASAAVTVEKRR